MFKHVEYVGFDGHPELKAKAEQLTPMLANEINTWRDDVEVHWTPHAGPDGVLDLTLSLTLENGVSGAHTGTFTREDFEEDWLRRWRCRRVWDDLLGVLLEKLQQRTQGYLIETAEV